MFALAEEYDFEPPKDRRQAVRGGNIVLGVDSDPVAPTARRITVAIVQPQVHDSAAAGAMWR